MKINYNQEILKSNQIDNLYKIIIMFQINM